MNTRIQELAEECKLVYVLPDGSITECSPNIQMFAEMIIEESISAASWNNDVGSDDFREGVADAMRQIKSHWNIK